jgi:hypothetical protein
MAACIAVFDSGTATAALASEFQDSIVTVPLAEDPPDPPPSLWLPLLQPAASVTAATAAAMASCQVCDRLLDMGLPS